MRDEHEHREVEDLSVDAEMACDSFVDHLVPDVSLLDFSSVETDAITPEMTHLSELELHLLQLSFVSNFI